jgi:ribosomal protein L37E
MEARCKLFGHVRDSTEFEERREERPNGTVLICREYQVCRRCGDREEMYRNEQMLAAESTEPDSRTAESTEPDARTAETVDDTAPRENASESESVGAGASSTAGPGHQAPPDAAGTERVTHDAVIIDGSTTDADPSTEERHQKARTDGTGDSLAASDESGSPTSSFDTGDDDEQIRCESCGREWRRDDTSLREGDLCPGCREAYVGGA